MANLISDCCRVSTGQQHFQPEITKEKNTALPTIILQPKPRTPKIEFLASKDTDQRIQAAMKQLGFEVNEDSDPESNSLTRSDGDLSNSEEIREETPNSPDIDITKLISLGDFIKLNPETFEDRVEECYQMGLQAEENGHIKQAMFYYMQVGAVDPFHEKANQAFDKLRWPSR